MTGVTDSLAFRLGTLGSRVADRLAGAVAEYDVKPKHLALLVAVERRSADPAQVPAHDDSDRASQLELARALRIAPSLVVQLADHLVALGAIERRRDERDRRRQYLLLTPVGRRLLAACADAARRVDEELAAPLDPGQREELRGLLGVLVKGEGLPTRPG